MGKNEIGKCRQQLVISLLLLCVAACGEIAYKRGAGPGAFDERAAQCRALGEDRYPACMAEHGWTLHRQSGSLPEDWHVPPVGEQKPAMGGGAGPQSGAYEGQAGQGKSFAAGAVRGQALPQVAGADPLARFSVSSWWKLGASAAQLESAMAGCSAQLGPQHRPDGERRMLTRGMILCMRSAGWFDAP